ncbi:MAG: cytidylate kinase-like family protein [Clostridiales bacterium]|nr:cytidylate kinase-like family protein [Clostridiales bacterium]
MKDIITIGRQFGSGGREIGLKLAQELGYAFYDKAVLAETAKKLGVCEALLEQSSESSVGTFIYNVVLNNREESFEDKLAKQEFDYLRKQVKKGPCVIIGRCASYHFRDNPGMLSIFITAPMEKRVERILSLKETYGADNEKAAKRMVQHTDKKRANYYNYYTNQRWGDMNQYHLILDSTLLGVDGTVDALARLIRNT